MPCRGDVAGSAIGRSCLGETRRVRASSHSKANDPVGFGRVLSVAAAFWCSSTFLLI